MSVALRGSLEDFGIAEVFQLIGQQQKTGLLDISADSKTMRLAFDEGRVVWASPAANTEDAVIGDQLVRSGLLTQQKLGELQRESEASARSVGVLAASAGLLSEIDLESVRELVTQETIFEVLRWTGGSFHFSAQAVVHDRPPEKLLAAEQILMDGLRMVDEWQTFAGLVPSRDTVFQRNGQIESYREQVSGDAAHRLPYAERVFALVDGRLSAGRIIDLSRLGLFEGTRALAELHRASLIAPLAGRLARSRARAGRAPRRRVAE